MDEEHSTPASAGMIRTPSYALATQNEANEVSDKNLKNCISKTSGDGSASPCSSTTEEDDDTKSSCSSGKDSGVGKTGYDSSDASNSSRRNSVGSRLKKVRYVRESSPALSSSSSIGKLQSVSQADLQSNASLLWGASLLYHTGIPTPKVKVNHLQAVKPHSEPSQIKPASSSTSVFSTLRSRSTGKLFHSTLSLRSSEEVTRMDDGFQKKSPWRFGGSSKKLNTPNMKASSMATLDSSGGQGSSGMRTMATPDSGFLSGASGYSSGGAFSNISPVRNRHQSCISSTPKTSNPGGGMLGARGKVKNSSSSLRLLKSVTSKTSTLMENSSNSLPRGMGKISNLIAGADEDTARESSTRSQSATLPTAIPSSSSSSSSGFKSAKKALRSSFKAAKSFLPIPSSKIGPSGAEKVSSKNSREKLSFYPSPLSDDEGSSSVNATSSALNSSAPNTPVVGKKSRLERARKRFASTLSLNTGGGSSSNSSNNGSNTIGGYPSRSKSTSTLVISDSEHVPSASVPTGAAIYPHQQSRFSHHRPTPISKLGSLDTLAVVEGDQITSGSFSAVGDDGNSKIKGDSGSRSKSPFRFMTKSKTGKEKKSDSALQGFEIAPAPNNPQNAGTEQLEREKDSVTRPLSPEASDEFPSKSTQPKKSTAEKEKPNKKRLSFMKTLVDKTMRRGSSSGSKKADIDDSDYGFKPEAEKKETVLFYKTPGASVIEAETSRGKRRSTSRERRQVHDEAQEIVEFDNEPKVRKERRQSGGNPEIVALDDEPKVRRKRSEQEESQEIVRLDSEPKVRTSGRQRFSSGSGLSESTTSSTITCTPPNAPPIERPFSPSCEQDREIHELVVSETSIDISPRKVSQSAQPNFSHFNATNTSAHNEGGDLGNQSKSELSETHTTVFKREKSGFFGRENPVGQTGSNNIQGIDATDVPTKKPKSPSFMRRIISLSPSSSFVLDKNMEDSIKKKKKVSKKSSKKLPLETTDAELSAPPEQGMNTGEAAAYAARSESTPQPNSISGISNDNDNSDPPVASSRRRKSSEDFKELRKNAIQSNGMPPIDANESSNGEGNDTATNQPEAVPTTKGTSKANGEDEEDTEKNGENNEVDETDDPETACTESFRQLKPFNYDLEPVEEGKKERLYKVLVVGELGAGKTSIIKRYVHQFFSQHYRATIGVDFALKVLRWDPDTVVRLQLWDIAGQERFGSMTRVYYKEAVGAFVVFDVTRSATLEAVPKWKADLDAKVALPDGRPIPTVLLANKSDQPKEGIAANREKMNDFCQQQGFSAWFETSAKDNINIDESANFLVSKILEMDKWSQEPVVADPDKVELTANGKHKGSPSSNCAC